MKNIFDLNLVEYIKYLSTLNDEEIKKIVLSSEFIKANDYIINSTFSTTNNKIKDLFINDEKLLHRLLISVQTQKIKFNVIEKEFQLKIIKNIKPFLKLNDKELYNLIKSMDKEIYEKFIFNLNNYIYDNEIESRNSLVININNLYMDVKNKTKDSYYIDEFKNYIKKQFNIENENLLNQITYNFISKNRNIFQLYKIETFNQLYIYNKFNIYVTNELFNEENQIKYNIPIDLLEMLNAKHVIKIINTIKNKEKIVDNNKLFIISIKLYCLFGLDNALKIINDNFTYSTSRSIEKAANFNFIYERRNYRINHQDEFYSYETIEKLKKALQNNEQGIIKKISSDSDSIYVNVLFQQLRENYILYKNDQKMLNYLNQTIKKEINDREQNIKSFYTAEYYQNNMNKRNEVSYLELFDLFSEFDCFLTKFDINGNVVMEKQIRDLLLDNEKKDNNCLLRMILNKQMLDYNFELINIINEFKKISEILKFYDSEYKRKTFSERELLNILDVHKIFQFKLGIDEQDIPLSALSKTLISKKHLIKNENEVLKIFKDIYKKMKLKFSSTIPKVKGKTKDNIRYKVLDKNDIELLTCGIDTGSCFKPGGLGEDFYKYALTSKYSDVIGIWDNDNNLYICPIIRNGNGIYGNGIDPSNVEEEKIKPVITALKKCYTEIMKKSDNKEKIEFCTLTNLNGYISLNDQYNQIEITNVPILDENFYCDIIKNNKINFVISGDASNIKEYKPTIEYYINRQKNYTYSKEQKHDKLIIEQRINEIEYKSIDFLNTTKEEKNKLKEEYKTINLDEFIYVVCNEDWYICMRDDLSFKTVCLPYDFRAKKEYLREFSKIRLNYELYTVLEEKEKIK